MSELNKCHVCGAKCTSDDLLGDGEIVHYCSNSKCFLHDLIATKEQWNALTKPQGEWVSVKDFEADKPQLVYANCNDIVNGWVEVLLINRDGELFFPHGIRYPALVTHVMPLTLPTPPKD